MDKMPQDRTTVLFAGSSCNTTLEFSPTETYLKDEKNFKTRKGRRTKVSKQVFEIVCFNSFVKKLRNT